MKLNVSKGRLWLAAVLVLACCAAACSSGNASGANPCPDEETSPLGPTLVPLNFKNSAGSNVRLCVRVEADEQARERGLMNVAKLPDDNGDLFAWPDHGDQDVVVPFWMKDTQIPLTIAFVSADGHVLEEQDMQAETETLHSPKEPYRFSIEANLGWYDRHKVTTGSTVDLPAALVSLGPH